MSRRCQMTRKSPMAGHTVSHANNRKKTRRLPNLQKRKVFVAAHNLWITLKLSTRAIRTLDKYGGNLEIAAKKFKELQQWI